MITMIMFIDRKEELNKLMEIASSKKPELVLIYGRRRVGKSRLLVEFAKKTNALYLLADMSENILDILAGQVEDAFVRFNTWEDFFEFVYKCRHQIIIIDEFQYLYQINKAWPTVLQRWWEKIKETDKKIILCGSIISTIYKISMGYGSALYGRKTSEIQVTPLKFSAIKDFFPGYSIKQLIKAYSILGGVPRYLEEFDSKLSIEENVKKKILDKTAFLYNEPMNLLFEEFRDPAPYASILLAITQGYVKFAEIAEISKLQSHKLSKYLLVLERAGLIEKEIPVTEKKIKTKTTKYRVNDNFYKFWFRFIFKNKSAIERGLLKEVFGAIKEGFNSFVGKSFEDMCIEFVIDTEFFNLTKIGKWWHKDKEIDIVAVNDDTKEILFCECKWQNKVNARKIVDELKAKAKFVEWNNGERKERYCVFAKSFKEEVDDEDITLFDLKRLERVFEKK